MTMRIRYIAIRAGVVLVPGGVYGASALMGGRRVIDPAPIAIAQTGKMIRSVVVKA